MIDYTAMQDMICNIGMCAIVLGMLSAFMAAFLVSMPRLSGKLAVAGVVLGMGGIATVCIVCMTIPYQPMFLTLPPVR